MATRPKKHPDYARNQTPVHALLGELRRAQVVREKTNPELAELLKVAAVRMRSLVFDLEVFLSDAPHLKRSFYRAYGSFRKVREVK